MTLKVNYPRDTSVAVRSAIQQLNKRLDNTITKHLTDFDNPHQVVTSDVSPLSTKGDLFTFSTVDTRLPVGTNGQALMVNSGEATGLKWNTLTASHISDFDTEVSNNTSVTDNTTHRGLTDNPHSVTATQVSVDTTLFAGNLSSADDTVQKALDTLDDLTFAGANPTGGAEGQMLVKDSATNYDYSWDVVLSNYNTRLGLNALDSLSTGTNITCIGAYAGENNNTGIRNTFYGAFSGRALETGDDNTYYGYGAGLHCHANRDKSTFIGSYAGDYNTSGTYTAIGYKAGNNTSSGYSLHYGVSVGAYAGENNQYGFYNVLLGGYAGNTCDGEGSIAIGYRALFSTTSAADNNIAIGMEAMDSSVTGDANIGIGRRSGYSLTSGNANTMIGDGTGLDLTTGNYNTFLGYQAGYNVTGGNDHLFLGYQAGDDITSANNLFIVNTQGTTSTTGALLYGVFDPTASSQDLTVNADLKITYELEHLGNKIGFFGTSPVVQDTVADLASATAGASYTATEQTMLQNCYDKVNELLDALQSYGLV